MRPAPAGAPSAVRLGLGQQVAAGYQNLMGLGASHFLLDNYETAIEFSLKSLSTFNDLIFTYVCLACCHAALGRLDKGRAMARRVRELNPELTIKVIEEGAAGRADAFAVGIVPWLRKIDFPER